MIFYNSHYAITHAHSLPSEITQINHWCLVHIHYLCHNTPTHHYSNNLSQIFVPSLLNNSSYHPGQENTALIPIWSIPSLIHLWLQKSAFCVTSSMTSTSKLYKPRLPDYKNPRTICYLMSTVHIPTIQYTSLPLIIHHMLSITIHKSTHQPIKTHHDSQPS